MIPTFLDTDFYKLTMGQFVWESPKRNMEAEYRLFVRSDLEEFSLHFPISEFAEKLAALGTARINPIQDRKPKAICEAYWDWLKSEHLRVELVRVLDNGGGFVKEIIIKGPWQYAILLEVPVLALLSEIYHQDCLIPVEADDLIWKKRNLILKNGLKVCDFGTRRRFSQEWHRRLLWHLKGAICGTSNVHFAQSVGMPVIGTMAHEFLQAYQVFVHPRDSQKRALEHWYDRYKEDNLLIALSDVFNLDAFLVDFYQDLAQKYDGCRQDSGDPFDWANRMIAHYKYMGIDPREKTFVFSDNLNFDKVLQLHNRYKDLCNPIFGIGTNLTCDIPGIIPMNAVIKLVKLDGEPVAKLSDSQGKEAYPLECPEYLEYIRGVVERKVARS